MKLIKPVWVNHGGQPIFSVDINPDGTKFATGGQGGDAGRVVIWNLGPVIDVEQEKKESVPKLLCQMDNHLACVNVVRWSNSGKYLASAGDDQIIMVWQISKYLGSSASSLFRGTTNVEQWRCIATLRGHSGDILDLNWSPQDEYIASGSVDNNVIVWNARKFPEVIARIQGHNGFVKGVSWDPIGKYLASQSDDKSVKLWRVKDWKEETSIREPFRDCGGTTHVLRLNWSPDGQFLVSAHAMNNRGSTAQIIEREGWKAQKDFVGHRKAVTCVRFNPNLLKEKSNFYTLIALGSRDKSLSVWSTRHKRPRLVIHDLFENSILDISWSRDGYTLLSCSWDGTVVAIQFNPIEIGTISSEEAKTTYLQKLYGKSLQSPSKETLLVEDPQILKIREEQLRKQKEKEKEQQEMLNSSINDQNRSTRDTSSLLIQNGSNESISKSAGDSRSSLSRLLKGPTDKQIEIRMPDGRRRITPLYIPPPTDLDGAPIPFTLSQTTFSSSTEPKASIVVERRDESGSATSTPVKSCSTTSRSENQTSTPKGNQLSKTHISPATPVNQGSLPSQNNIVVSSESQLKKSETPNESTSVLSSLPAQSSKPSALPETTEKRPSSPHNSLNPSTKKLKPSSTSTSQASKILKTNDPNPMKTVNGSSPHLTKKSIPTDKRKGGRTSLGLTNKSGPPLTQPRTEEKSEKPTSSRAESRASSVQFPSLKIDKSSNVNVKRSDESGEISLVIEVENNINNSTLSVIRAMNQDNEKIWEVILSAKICGLAACEFLAAIACDDQTLSVFSTSTGRRLHPPLLLNSLAARLFCSKYYLMVITSKASLWLWNFEQHQVVVKNESLLPLFLSHGNMAPSDISLVNTGITDSGSPLITLSTGKSYVFDTSFSSWSLISNTQDLLNFSSDYKPNWKSDVTAYPLAVIQSQHRLMKSSHNIFLSNSNLQRNGTLSFIDQQLASAFVIGSSKEYRYWLIVLAQFLTEEDLETRLRELCQYLLGPPFTSSESKWERSILGNDKHELLHEILAITTSNLKLQRIYTEFKQQLDLISSSTSSPFSSSSPSRREEESSNGKTM